jgi:cyanophycin synthetase
MSELENWSPQAQAGAGISSDAPAADPDYVAAEPVTSDA